MKSKFGKRALESRQQQILLLYAGGMTTTEIGNRFQVSKTAVGAFLKRRGIPLRKKSDYNKVDATEAATIYQTVGSIRAARKILGVGNEKLLRALNVAKIIRVRGTRGPTSNFWKGGGNKTRAMKRKAQAKLRYAIRKGRLVRQPCESCGAPANMSQGHHADYSKPLDVVWLCRGCHRAAHSK